MTIEEKLNNMKVMMGVDDGNDQLDGTYKVYLDLAKQKLITHIYPFDNTVVELPNRYDLQQIELAIALFNQRGAEGESSHSENGVARKYKTEQEILRSIPTFAGIPK